MAVTYVGKIWKLSNELLILIFEFLLTSETSSPAHSIFDLQRMPWILTHVCSRWRTVVTTSPEFWTNFSFIWSDGSKPELLRLCLNRSKARPIHIKFFHRYDEETLRILSAHSSRWKSLAMDVEMMQPDIFEPIRGQLSLLEELNLTVGRSSPVPLILTAFSDAPQLNKVALRCPVDSKISLPWQQLRRFEGFIESMSPRFLGETPNLESYHLTRWHQSNFLLLDLILCPTMLRHHNLCEISVKFIEDLKHLELPALRSLEILVPSYTTFYQLDRLISRSNCSLTKFSLGYLHKRR
ncbi:hypothetical protein BDN72DRAFT_616045 [Pluteus cervinus]|uniref:Uncharacterized protein n=1 Tax=Pluteus cervinus TaxID=181527 RepID=A0ACD3AU52_9AGAR|nr:hypothetical protein BDN72DRAFT_616045 [Pluteus cervinus]